MEIIRGESIFRTLNGVKTTRIVHNIIYNQQRYKIHNIDKIKYEMLVSYTPIQVVSIIGYQRYVTE